MVLPSEVRGESTTFDRMGILSRANVLAELPLRLGFGASHSDAAGTLVNGSTSGSSVPFAGDTIATAQYVYLDIYPSDFRRPACPENGLPPVVDGAGAHVNGHVIGGSDHNAIGRNTSESLLLGNEIPSQATSGDVVKLHVSRTFLSKLANDSSRNHQEFIEVDAHAQFSDSNRIILGNRTLVPIRVQRNGVDVVLGYMFENLDETSYGGTKSSDAASTGGRKCDTGTEWVTKPPDASTSEQLEVVALSRGDTGSNSTNGLLEHVASSGEENSGKAGVAADEGSKMGAHIAFQPEKTDAGSKKLDGFKFFANVSTSGRFEDDASPEKDYGNDSTTGHFENAAPSDEEFEIDIPAVTPEIPNMEVDVTLQPGNHDADGQVNDYAGRAAANSIATFTDTPTGEQRERESPRILSPKLPPYTQEENLRLKPPTIVPLEPPLFTAEEKLKLKLWLKMEHEKFAAAVQGSKPDSPFPVPDDPGEINLDSALTTGTVADAPRGSTMFSICELQESTDGSDMPIEESGQLWCSD